MKSLGLAIIALLFLTACDQIDVSKLSDQDLERLSDKLIVCNEPYIRVGADCCLDQNSNGICDADETGKPKTEEKDEPAATEPIELVLYTDYECPFCQRWHLDSYASLKEEYLDIGKAELEIKHFPLSSIHPQARAAAIAGVCAEEQGKLEEFTDAMFRRDAELSTSLYVSTARALKLDVAEFEECLKTPRAAAVVDADTAAGEAAGVTGTPTLFIDGEPLVGAVPYSALKARLE